MKTMFLRLGCAALCLALSVSLLAGCALLPAASPLPTPAPVDEPLYDASALDDGQLRILSYNGVSTVLCGSTVLHEGRAAESIYLVPDTLTGEVSHYWVSYPDASTPSGRGSALYDSTGTEQMRFDREYTATLTGDVLILTTVRWLEMMLARPLVPEDCRVLELATGRELPTPTNAYQCCAVGQVLAFSCYDRPAGLGEDDWDDDLYLHTRAVLTDREGTVLREEEACTASGFSAQDVNSLPTDWLALSFYGDADAFSVPCILYDPATGEELAGFDQACGNGTASFRAEDGSYQLIDLASGEHSQLLCSFEEAVSYYVPGAAITWNRGGDFVYRFYDLVSGQSQDVYSVDVSNTTLAVYTLDDVVRVYDRRTGALLTDAAVEPIPGQKRAQVSTEGGDFVSLILYANTDYTQPTLRIYNADGLVCQMETPASAESYFYFGSLSYADGMPYFRRGYYGPNGSFLYDVLDAEGNVLLQGLSLCSAFYEGTQNALPDGAFVARKGFYYGWMTPEGRWLYCQSIFSSTMDEENADYYLML